MSKHVTLNLHYPEETITCDFTKALIDYPKISPTTRTANPITDYFITSSSLIRKIIDTNYSNDSEILGLLVLGVISSTEFYFRTILSQLPQTCKICELHTESLAIASGSIAFYAESGFSPMMQAFEHESLADSKKITTEINRFLGFKCAENTSVKAALDDFERLCELRHCFIHARGFAGLKAVKAIGGERSLKKVLITRDQALDFIKVSHNVVRAVNRYLSDEILNRWINKDLLTGEWRVDKKLFTSYIELFQKTEEVPFGETPQKIFSKIRPVIVKRRQAALAAKP